MLWAQASRPRVSPSASAASPPKCLVLALLCSALLAPAAAFTPRSPINLQFYPPGALLVDGEPPAGRVTFASASAPLERLAPDEQVELVATSEVAVARIAFVLEDMPKWERWVGTTAPLALRGTDQTGKFIYSITLTAPPIEGFFTVAVNGDSQQSGSSWQQRVEIDVTCSNGIFCDGAERFLNGKCRKAHASTMPCVFGAGECFIHECIEEVRSCSPRPLAVESGSGAACSECSAPELLVGAASAALSPSRSAAAAIGGAAAGDKQGPLSGASCTLPKPIFGAHRAEQGEETFIIDWEDETTSSITKLTPDNLPASSTRVPVEGIRLRIVQNDVTDFEDTVLPTCAGAAAALPCTCAAAPAPCVAAAARAREYAA